MVAKSIIIPELKRVLKPPFAWINRRFLFNGFLAELSPQENLLYFFLVLVADRDGLSYYNYDKICQLLKLDVDDYVQARNSLIEKKLIALDNCLFQVLTLPEREKQVKLKQVQARSKESDFQAIANIFSKLTQFSGQS
ncbi:MAG: hypothetical protein DRI37_03890 [Chloroflexi bacterium]|nr:MAG: hypothetical protein DRI37_03890 [Chloroflexota bacterium]